MTATKPRAWLQLRLVTCIIAMFVAALLLGGNLVGRVGERKSSGKYRLSRISWLQDPRDILVEYFVFPKSFGWPWEYRFEHQTGIELPEGGIAYETNGPHSITHNENLKWNIGAGLCILLSVVVVTEWFGRRRRSSN